MMNKGHFDERTDREDLSGLSPQALEDLLRLLVLGQQQRISSADLDGRRVWIKRYDAEPTPLSGRIHAVLSPLIPVYALRASPKASAAQMVEREVRKMKVFREAGFETPQVLHSAAAIMVLSDQARIVQHELDRLRLVDTLRHDRLLIEAAAVLGRAHSRGLCHGRPHPRDMFIAEGGWGFVDFEEEPEASMPLCAAQARDVWLLFLQISTQALQPETEDRALAAYRAEAPSGSLIGLKSIINVLSPLLPVLSLVEKVSLLGSDGRRLLSATRFLKGTLAATGAETETSKPVAAG
ncbi:hypothetical protein NTH_02098 [Nitratireductor thuwali]|uniref:Serine/threonine protein phosphatase n=2 Tax=Nitratireductor thuwali TaxID=2267699 RepID=A0ABY5MJZ4_9HYPH|nr:hypothetical protein NTH_02098 [Nitratireductor thuwali]